MATRKELRDRIKKRTRETQSTVNAIINDLINNTLDEIQSPGWAFRSPQSNTVPRILRLASVENPAFSAERRHSSSFARPTPEWPRHFVTQN